MAHEQRGGGLGGWEGTFALDPAKLELAHKRAAIRQVPRAWLRSGSDGCLQGVDSVSVTFRHCSSDAVTSYRV
jgi:hypothetical protein